MIAHARISNFILTLPPLGAHLTRENVHVGKTRREFTPEYKDEAVKLVINTGRAVATVARELGINEASLG
ncbi:transposase [Cryobacterium sp. Y11]|uniref:transposase n=1 Tax=Cryobacterium sp. Y11 TaxID=2045016 RepID=UPI000CE46A38|nr:transposase [Cryobacterium sp. Y11]